MASVEERLSTLGLALPKPMVAPPGVVLPFQSVRIIDDRALISGHGPQNPDGSIAGPLGKPGTVPGDRTALHRPRGDQHLDRPPLVHGRVARGHRLQVDDEVKHR